MVFRVGFQGPLGVLLVEHLCFRSLGGAMDVPNVISKYNIMTLSLYYLTCLYFYRLWCMSLAEVYGFLSFGVYRGWKLRNYMGLF